MAVEKKRQSLLENIADKAGCEYLSDLRYKASFGEIQRVLREIQPDLYSIKVWNDAVTYITGEKISFDSREEAVYYLKTYGKNI